MKTLLVSLVVALSTTTAASAHQQHPRIHCGTNVACIVSVAHRACKANHHDQHHCAIWRRHDHVAVAASAGIDGIPGMTPLAWCVSGLESGHGANVNNGAGDLGWFQFLTSTYDNALGLLSSHGIDTSGWDKDPLTAPVAQQTAAFDILWPIVTDTTAGWPATGAICISEGYS